MGGAHVGPPAPLQNRFPPVEQQPGRAITPHCTTSPRGSKKFPKLGDSFPALRRLDEDKEEEEDKETHQERPSRTFGGLFPAAAAAPRSLPQMGFF